MVKQNEDADLQFAEQFFTSRGLTVERIREGTTKTPDFRLRRGSEVVGFCEVKSPQDIFVERAERAVNDGAGQLSGVVERGFTSRQYRCIDRAARKAAEQLRAANPSHSVPNILMVVNHDNYAVEEDFAEAITGYFKGQRVIAETVRDAIPEIDAYVWADRSREEVAPVRFLRHNSPLKETVRELLKLG
jgi:hypothetical protein